MPWLSACACFSQSGYTGTFPAATEFLPANGGLPTTASNPEACPDAFLPADDSRSNTSGNSISQWEGGQRRFLPAALVDPAAVAFDLTLEDRAAYSIRLDSCSFGFRPLKKAAIRRSPDRRTLAAPIRASLHQSRKSPSETV